MDACGCFKLALNVLCVFDCGVLKVWKFGWKLGKSSFQQRKKKRSIYYSEVQSVKRMFNKSTHISYHNGMEKVNDGRCLKRISIYFCNVHTLSRDNDIFTCRCAQEKNPAATTIYSELRIWAMSHVIVTHRSVREREKKKKKKPQKWLWHCVFAFHLMVLPTTCHVLYFLTMEYFTVSTLSPSLARFHFVSLSPLSTDQLKVNW